MTRDAPLLEPTKEGLERHIAKVLHQRKDILRKTFFNSIDEVGVRYVAIDELLPTEWATAIALAFPKPKEMRLMKSFRERKYTSKAFDEFDPLLRDITFAFQSSDVISLVEEITGILDQSPDSHLYAGGLSAMGKGHYLSPHIDNSHDFSRSCYRTLNLLYYVTPDWREEFGGNLQLWDNVVRENVIIHSRFNRLVLMETTPTSWHSVNPVKVDGLRKCVSNYYFSDRSPTGEAYFNVTAFNAPPDRPFLRLWSRADNGVRNLVRKVRASGVGKVDLYRGPPK